MFLKNLLIFKSSYDAVFPIIQPLAIYFELNPILEPGDEKMD